MTRKRAMIAGMTDYTGVGLEDIMEHIHEWRNDTNDAIKSLCQLRQRVSNEFKSLRRAEDIIEYIDYFNDLFSRYAYDFQRLTDEMKYAVQEKHVETISQIFDSSYMEERHCVEFKKDQINRTLEDESKRPLLDEIYQVTRGLIIDYKDLSNVHRRLITFIEKKPQPVQENIDNVDLMELKPNFFGIGLNVNNIIKRIKDKFKNKKNKVT